MRLSNGVLPQLDPDMLRGWTPDELGSEAAGRILTSDRGLAMHLLHFRPDRSAQETCQ